MHEDTDRRKLPNTDLTREGNEMVFAKAGYVDITNENHFIMILCKDSIVDNVCPHRGISAIQKEEAPFVGYLPNVLHNHGSST